MTKLQVPTERVLANLRQAAAALEGEAIDGTSSHFRRKPKLVLIVSVSDAQTRAICATGVGNTLDTAWRAAIAHLRKRMPDEDRWQWIKIDVVHSIRVATPPEVLAELSGRRRNYFRHGIAFDPNFNAALLEQELNGIAAWACDGGRPIGLNFERINRYLQTSRRQPPLSSGVQQLPAWYLFDTKSLFGDRTGEVRILADCGFGQGIRAAPMVADDIENLIDDAGMYLTRQMRDDGSFVYGYFPAYDAVIPTYNILRHCGTLYAMLEAWEAAGNGEIGRHVPRGIDHVLRTAMRRDGDRLFVVDHANHGEIKLGAQAVLVLTIAKFTSLTRDARYLPVARALAKGIVERFLDPASGAFVHVLQGEALAVKDRFRIVFYDGEAVLALLRLHEIDRDPLWLTSAIKAFEHFIRTDHWKHHDHWLAYCANEITRHHPEQRYFEFGLKNGFGNLPFIRERETAYPTFLELLMATLLLVDTMKTTGNPLPPPYDVRALVEAIDHRAEHQRFACFYPEMAMYFKAPQRIAGSFFSRHHAFRVRIDDVEHFISGYCLYLHNVVRIRRRMSRQAER